MAEADEPGYIAIKSQPISSYASEGKESSLRSARSNNGIEPLDQKIANLAHDLRTPFISIRGYTKMMLEQRAGPINDTQREYLTIVAENTNRVIQLLNDLLQLAAKQPLLRLEPVDVCGLAREVLEIVRAHALGKSIRIMEQIPPAPLLVMGDRQKLMGTFAEILFNTVKYTDRSGGEIIVEVSDSNQGNIMIRISSTGVGMPAKFLNKVLPGTDQLEASAPDRRETLDGTGFSEIQNVIQSHGGGISVSSEAGESVGFLIVLPAL